MSVLFFHTLVGEAAARNRRRAEGAARRARRRLDAQINQAIAHIARAAASFLAAASTADRLDLLRCEVELMIIELSHLGAHPLHDEDVRSNVATVAARVLRYDETALGRARRRVDAMRAQWVGPLR